MVITTTPNTPAPPLDIPLGYWEREDSHNPRPLTPLGASIFVDGLNQSFPKVFARFGMLLETLAYRLIGGYVYTTAVSLGSKAGDKPRGLPPKPIFWLLVRTVPMLRRRLKRCETAMRDREDLRIVEQWTDEWRPQLIRDIERLRAVDLLALSDEELSRHFRELRDWTFFSMDVHFYLTAPYAFALSRLNSFCDTNFGFDDLQVMRLLSGLSEASSEPAVALAALAGRIRADAELASKVVDASAANVPAIVQARGGEIAAAYDEYVHRYAFRALRYEVIEPNMDEQPELVAQLLQDQLRRPHDLRTEIAELQRDRSRAIAEARAMLQDDASKTQFAALLADAERIYPTREDNEFFTVSVPLALMRRAALETGRRLVKNDVIAIEEDVFFLTADEIVDALSSRPDGDALAEQIIERRANFDAANAWSPPHSYGEEPPLPPLDVLPPLAREAMQAMLYAREKIFQLATDDDERPADAPGEITGRAAARGSYTGTARLIMGEHEFDKLQPGDVLVCPITSPVWSVLFAKVGALVTDAGGILSHPAIIAREYRIPAVVATRDATSRLRDGQLVLVDGDAGIVRIVE
jgi:pyruvate,water dikinase